MKRSVIKYLIEKMTVSKSGLGVFRIDKMQFDLCQATTWVESIRPHTVVDDTEFTSMKTAFRQIGEGR